MQQLTRVESLASVVLVCLDKTGTLTEDSSPGSSTSFRPGGHPDGARGRFAASATARNDTLQAIADAYASSPHALAAATVIGLGARAACRLLVSADGDWLRASSEEAIMPA